MTHSKITIGALANATSVPVETIRTWERRYGFPQSKRNEAGHRIYSVSTIEHLRIFSRAIELGHRPSQLAAYSVEDLHDLIEKTIGTEHRNDRTIDSEPNAWLEQWIDAVVALDSCRLNHYLQMSWHQYDMLYFLEKRLHPFLVHVGKGWASGKISVYQEHASAEFVRDFLISKWRPLANAARGPHVVCACLPEELHSLSLHMLALIMTLAGYRVHVLVGSTPTADIVAAVRQSKADTLLISISAAARQESTQRDLLHLQQELPDNITLFVGGAGAKSIARQLSPVQTLAELSQWAHHRNLGDTHHV